MLLRVNRGAAAALVRGHPWVYRDALLRPPSGLASGAAVSVGDEAGRVLGHGYWDPDSPLAVRVVSAGDGEPFGAEVLAARVESAIARRDALFGDDTNAYRLCNGEGDRAPGLVLDRYADVAIARIDTAALEPVLPAVFERIRPVLADRGIGSLALRLAARGASASTKRSKIDTVFGLEPPERLIVRERGMRMEVDLAHGQKTGAFLDQRENRRRVRLLANGRSHVLNLFSYAGGFSVAAALGGAEHVTSVDVATAAHASAERSLRENGLDPRAHAFVSADAFAFLDQAATRDQRFDLVVSDPPSFAPNERARGRALDAYRRLHRAAARVLAKGGVLCAASCSSHVSLDDFVGTLDDAALGRSDLVLLEAHGQPADHPTLPSWPEGRYLKFVVLG